jgi:hypothetical protein
MKKIQAFSKLTSVNIIPKNAIDAAKDYPGINIDDYFLRNNVQGFVVAHKNGYSEFLSADEVAEKYSSNGKLNIFQALEMLHKLGTEWEAVSSDNKIQIWLDEKDGVVTNHILDDDNWNLLQQELMDTFEDILWQYL